MVGLALACTDTTGTALTYTVGGTVSGLAGSGLVLRDNDGDDLSVTANGPVVFTTPLASDAAYHVTVFAQPSSPTQSCVVTGGTGTMSHANITNIAVTCTVVPSVLGTHVIAFISAAPGASQWYRMDESGRTLIRDVAATETDPIASPDGQRIAFASRGGGSRGGLFVMGSDGSAVIQLTEMSKDSTSVPIGWSRDGTRVFYLTSALNAVQAADLSVVNAGGGAPIGLVTIPHSSGHALARRFDDRLLELHRWAGHIHLRAARHAYRWNARAGCGHGRAGDPRPHPSRVVA